MGKLILKESERMGKDTKTTIVHKNANKSNVVWNIMPTLAL